MDVPRDGTDVVLERADNIENVDLPHAIHYLIISDPI